MTTDFAQQVIRDLLDGQPPREIEPMACGSYAESDSRGIRAHASPKQSANR